MMSELEQKSFPFSPQINNSKSDKNRPKFFEGRLDALLDREKIKRQVYEDTRKDMEEEKLKECTFKPKVTKTYDPTKSTEQIPVYLKLFKLQAEKSEKLAKQREMEEKNKALEEVAQYTFQPALESNYKFFESSKNKEKPYKYDEAVDRLRMAAQKKFQQRKMLENNFDSKKYERVMKNKDQIRPFDITDMKKAPKLKDEKEEAKRREREKKEKEKKKAEEEAFSIQISVAKGKERLLRIKKSDDPREVAENFCRVYGLRNEDVLDRLTSTIRDFMNIYLTNNDNFDLQNNMEPDIFDNMESNLNLNQLQTNNINNTNINLSKELAASKASIVN